MANRDYQNEEIAAVVRKELDSFKKREAGEGVGVRALITHPINLVDAVTKLSALPTQVQAQEFSAAMRGNSEEQLSRFLEPLAEVSTDIEVIMGSIIGRVTPAMEEAISTQIINEGNFVNLFVFVHLMAEQASGSDRQNGVTSAIQFDPVIDLIARRILSLQYNQQFYYDRYMYYNSMQWAKSSAQIKTDAGLGGGVVLDILSAKLALQPAEIFMQMLVEHDIVLDQTSFAGMNQIGTERLETVIKTKLEQLRMYHRHGQILTSNLIDTYTTFLELKTGARASEIQEIGDQLLSLGDAALSRYVISIAKMVTRGCLPGGIDPGQLYAHRDAVSVALLVDLISAKADGFLRDTTTQGFTQRTGVSKQTAAGVATGYSSLMQDSDIAATDKQQGIIARATAVEESFGGTLGFTSAFAPNQNPMKDSFVQGSGGPNSMSQALQFVQSGEIPDFNSKDSAELGVALSLLLACIHTRIDFITRTAWELIPTTEVVHLLIVQRLSQYIGYGDGQRLGDMAINMYSEALVGHNETKFTKLKDQFTHLDANDAALIEADMKYTVDQQLSQIKEFVQNPQLKQVAMRAFIAYLTGKNREDRMIRDTLINRRTSTTAILTNPMTAFNAKIDESIRAIAKDTRHQETARANN